QGPSAAVQLDNFRCRKSVRTPPWSPRRDQRHATDVRLQNSAIESVGRSRPGRRLGELIEKNMQTQPKDRKANASASQRLPLFQIGMVTAINGRKITRDVSRVQPTASHSVERLGAPLAVSGVHTLRKWQRRQRDRIRLLGLSQLRESLHASECSIE